MKLLATPKSHFSRKVRLLLDHLALDYTCVDIGNVAETDPDQFAHNPMMQVPVLEDGLTWLIESDHIAAYIVGTYDPDDRYQVTTSEPEALNARAIMNGIMGNEVKLILSQRTGLDPEPHLYFQKAKAGIKQSLSWLEDHVSLFHPADQLTYAHFHFISMWDHLLLYDLVAMDYPNLAQLAEALCAQKLVAQSHPARP